MKVVTSNSCVIDQLHTCGQLTCIMLHFTIACGFDYPEFTVQGIRFIE